MYILNKYINLTEYYKDFKLPFFYDSFDFFRPINLVSNYF